MRNDVDWRVQVHSALADPVRLGIVDDLALSDRSPTELADKHEMRSNLLAHHLDVLEGAGVIERLTSNGDRRRRYVRLVPDRLTGMLTVPVLRAAGVVFVCTRNSARSQLAAAVWNARSSLPATSAGTEPADQVDPEALRAAQRHHLELRDRKPSRLDNGDLDGRLIVTVCDLAHEELADLARRARTPVLHWSIPDPAAERDFDDVVHHLQRRVAALAPAVQPS